MSQRLNLRATALGIALMAAFHTAPALGAIGQAALQGYSFNYEATGSGGIRPVQVFDDGTYTYFQFRDPGNPPAILVMVDGQKMPVPYQVRQPYVVVEGVTDRFILQRGGEMVTVERSGSRLSARERDREWGQDQGRGRDQGRSRGRGRDQDRDQDREWEQDREGEWAREGEAATAREWRGGREWVRPASSLPPRTRTARAEKAGLWKLFDRLGFSRDEEGAEASSRRSSRSRSTYGDDGYAGGPDQDYGTEPRWQGGSFAQHGQGAHPIMPLTGANGYGSGDPMVMHQAEAGMGYGPSPYPGMRAGGAPGYAAYPPALPPAPPVYAAPPQPAATPGVTAPEVAQASKAQIIQSTLALLAQDKISEAVAARIIEEISGSRLQAHAATSVNALHPLAASTIDIDDEDDIAVKKSRKSRQKGSAAPRGKVRNRIEERRPVSHTQEGRPLAEYSARDTREALPVQAETAPKAPAPQQVAYSSDAMAGASGRGGDTGWRPEWQAHRPLVMARAGTMQDPRALTSPFMRQRFAFQVAENQKLSDALKAFAAGQTWRIEWQADKDFTIRYGYTVFGDSFEDVLHKALAGYGLKATVFSVNRVIVIKPVGESKFNS